MTPRVVRRTILIVLVALLALAFMPQPKPPIHPGPLWEQTSTLDGRAPDEEWSRRGTSYAPIGLVVLDHALGLGLDLDPSGAAVRQFSFADGQTATSAANHVVVLAVRNGFEMQSGGQGVWRITDQVFRDDGCDAAHDDCFTVLVLSPEATTESWQVHLLLEHTH